MSPEKHVFSTENLSSKVEKFYPLKEVERVGKGEPENLILADELEIVRIVRKITCREDFKKIISPFVNQIDFFVSTPNGKKEILHGSYFYIYSFSQLSDEKMNENITHFLKHTKPNDRQITRGDFMCAMQYFSVPAAGLIFDSDLNKEERNVLLQRGIKSLSSHLDFKIIYLLGYCCMKTIAVHLDSEGYFSHAFH